MLPNTAGWQLWKNIWNSIPVILGAIYFGANALSQLKERERSMEWAERALALEGGHQVLYNLACVYALLDESDRN